jgi:hypothetical protein
VFQFYCLLHLDAILNGPPDCTAIGRSAEQDPWIANITVFDGVDDQFRQYKIESDRAGKLRCFEGAKPQRLDGGTENERRWISLNDPFSELMKGSRDILSPLFLRHSNTIGPQHGYDSPLVAGSISAQVENGHQGLPYLTPDH